MEDRKAYPGIEFVSTPEPETADVEGFNACMEQCEKLLQVECRAVEVL